MALWILSFCIMAIEAWGSIYFFDTFMGRKRWGRLDKCRYVVLYLAVVAVAFCGEYLESVGVKVLLAVLALTVFCMVFYRTDWKQSIFFSGLNYSLYFLADLLAVQLENILVNSEEAYISKPVFFCHARKADMALCGFYSAESMEGQEQLRGAFP